MISNRTLGKIAVAFATVAIAVGAVAIGFTMSAVRGQDNLKAAIVTDNLTLFFHDTNGVHNKDLATQLMKLAKGANKVSSTAGSPTGQSYWASNASDIRSANGGKLPEIKLFQPISTWAPTTGVTATDNNATNVRQNITHLSWRLVYISRTDAADPNPVFTFMAAGAYRLRNFNSTGGDSNYNTSALRTTVTGEFNTVLTNSFTFTDTSANVSGYIKAPSALPGLWQSNQGTASFTGTSLSDRIWITSEREVGNAANNLWKLDNAERLVGGTSYGGASWLRTPLMNGPVATLNAGNIGSSSVGMAYAARPAIHLSIADLACDHSDFKWETIEPATCSAQGTEQKVCKDCGDEGETRAIEELPPHEYINDGAPTPATCTERGVQQRICKNCQATGPDVSLPELPHVWVNGVRIPPTCLNPGWQEIVCKNCGTEGESVTINATGHNYGDPVLTPTTCAAQGYTIEICKNENCEEPERKVYLTDDRPPHVFIDGERAVTPPNCYTPGWWHRVCSDCGLLEREEGLRFPITCGTCDWCQSACSHTFPEPYEIVDAATCTLNGAKTSVCTECTFQTYVTILALGHDNFANIILPTCTSSGYTETTCRRCDLVTQTNFKNPSAHTWENFDLKNFKNNINWEQWKYWKDQANKEDKENWLQKSEWRNWEDWEDWIAERVLSSATCTNPGILEVKCEVCLTRGTSKSIPATNHAGTFVYSSDSRSVTCLAAGSTVYDCSRCETKSVGIYWINPMRHNFLDWEITDPTCTADGIKTRTCGRGNCGHVETVTIQKLSHSPSSDWRQGEVQSCSERVTEYQDCIHCGTELATRTGNYPDPCGECDFCTKPGDHDADCSCKICNPPHQCGTHCSIHCENPNCKICKNGDDDKGLSAAAIGLIIGGVVLAVGGAIVGLLFLRDRKRKLFP